MPGGHHAPRTSVVKFLRPWSACMTESRLTSSSLIPAGKYTWSCWDNDCCIRDSPSCWTLLCIKKRSYEEPTPCSLLGHLTYHYMLGTCRSGRPICLCFPCCHRVPWTNRDRDKDIVRYLLVKQKCLNCLECSGSTANLEANN